MARNSMPRVNSSLGSPSWPTPMSPVATPTASPLSPISTSAAGKPWIDFDAERLGLAAEVAADVAERADEVAVVVHELRQPDGRQAQPAGGSQKQELVLGHLGLERAIRVLPPVRQRAGRGRSGSITAPERMCAPISEPFSTTTTDTSPPCSAARCFRRIAVREPGRTRAHDHHVEVHRLRAGRSVPWRCPSLTRARCVHR